MMAREKGFPRSCYRGLHLLSGAEDLNTQGKCRKCCSIASGEWNRANPEKRARIQADYFRRKNGS